MGRGGHGAVWLVVVLGHAGLLAWLMQAMVPPSAEPSPVETVLYLDLVPAPTPVEPDEPAVEPPDDPPPPPPPRLPARRVVAPPMQAVFEAPVPLEPEAASERIDPVDDPFNRQPPAAPAASGFGRRDAPPPLPTTRTPRIAGEALPNAPLRGLRHRERMSPQQLLTTIGSFIGGGANAPVEAPCGGRMNGGDSTAEGFSPAWNKHYGCTRDEDGAGYDGTAIGMPDR